MELWRGLLLVGSRGTISLLGERAEVTFRDRSTCTSRDGNKWRCRIACQTVRYGETQS